jgi:septum formation topological specificity factor MinE
MTDTKKRTVLTPAERVAKAKAELAELEAKATAKDRAQLVVLNNRRDALVKKQGEINAKLTDVNSDIEEIKARLGDDDAPAAADVELPLDTEGDES